jgi:hypothetical protein
MPRYFFDLDDGQQVVDDHDGREVSSVRQAQVAAATALAGMVSEVAASGRTEMHATVGGTKAAPACCTSR